MDDQLAELVAQRLRVVGQPLRVKLIARLCTGSASVRELTEDLLAVQQNVSQHLAILHQEGIVARRKMGRSVYYELVDPDTVVMLDAAASGLARRSDELARITNETRASQRMIQRHRSTPVDRTNK